MNIKNISDSPKDLHDGRILAPGEVVEDFEMTPHEQGFVDSGHFLAFDSLGRRRSTTPKKQEDND